MQPAVETSIPAFRKYLIGVKSKGTARKYAAYVKTFLGLVRSNGYAGFSEIPPGFLSEHAAALSREGKAPSTVRVEVAAVKKYLDWVRGKGITVPMQVNVDLPPGEIVMRPVLPTTQFTEYFRQADAVLREPVRTAVMLLPCCGVRATEMVSLKLGHIHKARVKMHSRGGKEVFKTTLFLKVKGKGNKERHVPLMEEGVEILAGYLNGWRRSKPGTWLFPRLRKTLAGDRGEKPVSDRYLRSALQTMREPMGLEFTPHTMRRTYITMLWKKGVDLATIAKIAGHASIQTTINHYIVMEPGDVIRALHDAGSSMTED